MTSQITITHRLTGQLIWQAQAPTLAQALTQANQQIMKAWRYSDDGHFLGQSYQTLDLQGAQLAGADLSGADLSFIKVWDADLRGANLRGTKLWLTGFYRADLSGADLGEADLEGASWCLQSFPDTNAILTGANFAGCYLGMSWSSRVLLTELLRQAAGEDNYKQQAGEQIPIVDYERYGDKIAWRQWEQSDYPLKAWSLDVLSAYVHKDDCTLSPMIRDRLRTNH